MPTIQEILDQIAKLPYYESGPGATESEIGAFELAAAISLPLDYKEFLRRYSYASWFGKWVYGIFEQQSLRPRRKDGIDFDAHRKTLKARRTPFPPGAPELPKNAIVISDDGSGGLFLLFDARSEESGRVKWINFEDSIDPIQEWESFAHFIQQFIADTQALGDVDAE